MTKITLSRPLKIALLALAGAFVGAGLLFLYMLRFTTYLGDDPSACVHGASFHAPQEVLRLMGNGITYAQEARLQIAKVLAKHGYTGDVPMPDISTKAKAQAYIGLDMAGMEAKKEAFMENIVPKWLSMAKENGKLLDY